LRSSGTPASPNRRRAGHAGLADRRTVDHHRVGALGRRFARQRREQRRLSVPRNACDAKNLAAAHLEADIAQARSALALRRQPLDLQAHLALDRHLAALDVLEARADHLLGHASARSPARGSQVPTTLPPRRIVAVSHSALISCSLCEM
jgi:hypothetical protein